MTINEVIRSALSIFNDPVEFEVYQGTEKIYWVFNYAALGADYGDDQPNHERFLVQVHLFAPLNINVVQRVKKAKKALVSAGMTRPNETPVSNKDGRHIVLECEYVMGVEDG